MSYLCTVSTCGLGLRLGFKAVIFIPTLGSILMVSVYFCEESIYPNDCGVAGSGTRIASMSSNKECCSSIV